MLDTHSAESGSASIPTAYPAAAVIETPSKPDPALLFTDQGEPSHEHSVWEVPAKKQRFPQILRLLQGRSLIGQFGYAFNALFIPIFTIALSLLVQVKI